MRMLLLFLTAAGLGVGQDIAVKNPRTSSADIEAGAKTFRSHCSGCHGFRGEGGRGPNLTTGQYFHAASDLDLLMVISGGIPGTEMPGLFYSPDRVWQVVAYLRSIGAGAREGSRGQAAHGKELFEASGCRNCHRVAGNGGRLGPDLTNIGRSRSTEHLRQAVLNPNADVRQDFWLVTAKGPDGTVQGFLRNEDTWSVQLLDLSGQLRSLPKASLTNYTVEKKSKMPAYQGKFAGADLDDLVAYLSSLRPEGGAQ